MSSILTLSVTDMSCGHCVSAVSAAVGSLHGVERVDVDLDSKRVEVEGEPLDPGAIAEAIREAGYEAVLP
jgi:copper ion binding protein